MKKILLLLIVLGLGIWATRSSSGIDFVDDVIRFVKVRDKLNIDFEDVSSNMTEEDVKQKFKAVSLQCREENSPVGERVCRADIRTVNNVPGDLVAFFFEKNHLTQIILDTRRGSHDEMLQYLKSKYGASRPMRDQDFDDSPVIGWIISSGLLIIPEKELKLGNASRLLWVSKERLLTKR